MTKASTLCFVSPFTYRGYCYDYDIELYYLQSRYYSAEIGRFINTDDTQIAIATQGEILGANLFAYCNNNSVMNVDYEGTWSISKIKSTFSNILSYIKNAATKLLKWVKKEIKNFFNIISYKNGVLSMSTTAVSIVFDIIINSVSKTMGPAIKGFSVGLKIVEKLAKNKLVNYFKNQMVPVFTFGIINKTLTKIKYAIWNGVAKGAYAAIDYADSYITDRIFGKFQSYQIISFFSSWGNFLAGLFDVFDGKYDGRIKWYVR